MKIIAKSCVLKLSAYNGVVYDDASSFPNNQFVEMSMIMRETCSCVMDHVWVCLMFATNMKTIYNLLKRLFTKRRIDLNDTDPTMTMKIANNANSNFRSRV